MRRKPAESAAKSRDSAVPLKRRKSGPFTGRAEPRVYPRTPGDASRISESVFQQRVRRERQERAPESRLNGKRRKTMTTVRGRRLAVASVAAAAAGLLACVDSADRVTSIGDGGELGRIGDGNLVRVSNVQVVPGSAEAGDTVRLVGNVTVAPEVAFTVTGSVDGRAEPRLSAADSESLPSALPSPDFSF